MGRLDPGLSVMPRRALHHAAPAPRDSGGVDPQVDATLVKRRDVIGDDEARAAARGASTRPWKMSSSGAATTWSTLPTSVPSQSKTGTCARASDRRWGSPRPRRASYGSASDDRAPVSRSGAPVARATLSARWTTCNARRPSCSRRSSASTRSTGRATSGRRSSISRLLEAAGLRTEILAREHELANLVATLPGTAAARRWSISATSTRSSRIRGLDARSVVRRSRRRLPLGPWLARHEVAGRGRGGRRRDARPRSGWRPLGHFEARVRRRRGDRR